MLNLLSLLLGFGAWGFAVKARTGWSFSLCSASLLCQICYTQHLVNIRDWSAIEDTHSAVTFASAVLLAGTVILNTVAHYLKRK